MDFADYPQAPNGNFDLFKQENRGDTMHQDLGLDPSDPLNLLLNNSSQDSSMEDGNSSHGTPPDWSQLSSALWPNQGSMQQGNLGENMKYPGLGMDFLQMDMGFNPSMAVDPSALHYDNHGYNPGFDILGYQNQHLATEFLSAPFPFTFNSHPVTSESSLSDNDFNAQVKERRSSVTSSSESSSGASLSPVLEHSPAVPVSNDPADELAKRVRQTAGVMLAVSAGPPFQQSQLPPQAKLPIPRLPNQSKLNNKANRVPPKSTTSSSASSTASSPPPPSPSDDAALNTAPIHTSGTSVIPRPKTSHTTIERRYRTNLNARIQSLRQAVPALRVLEEKNKKAKTDGEEPEKPGVDVVDERGFVDGVKVARKGSKANVLGKAVEYIRVLKKREARLKREQNGLKSLIVGLVGGPALLKEWEQEWKEKFGGEEKDEIEDEEAEPMSDDDDGDEEGDGDEDDGRAKKKAKVVKAPKKDITKKPAVPSTDALGSIVVPEKRKRGRPRKVPVPTPSATSPEDTSSLIPSVDLATQPMVQDGQAQPVQQYLLATFALFSLFNSPFTSSATSQAHPHSHSGTVLNHISIPSSASSAVSSSYGWRELVHAFHLLVSALVFFSIVVPWLPKTFKRTRFASVVFSFFSSYFPHSNTSSSPQSAQCLRPSHAPDRTTLLDALAHTRRGAADEAYHLHAALGVPSGILGLATGWRKSGGEGFERKGLEQRAWVRLGELVALDRTTSTATRLQTYWYMRSHISWFKASTSDLSTLALILRPLSSTKANTLWNRAGKADFVRPFERLVLTSLTVDEAAERLAFAQGSADYAKHTPIGLLASILVRERLLKHASVLFVRTVLPDRCHTSNEDSWVVTEQDDMEEEEKRKETIDAGKSLGGRMRELAEALEKIWGTSAEDVEDVLDHRESSGQKGNEAEVALRSLLSALILYRRIFPSSILSCVSATGTEPVSFILSPPPSPSRKNLDLHLALRRVLGSPVFDSTFSKGDAGDEKLNEKQQQLGIALEDARDLVVDMLVESERAGRKA